MATAAGPQWLEDSNPKARRAASSFEHTRAVSSRAVGGESSSSASGAGGTERAPSAALAAFNRAKSGDKAVAALVSYDHVDGEPETIAAFLLANDGKLDASKVGDYLGGRDAAARETARIVIGSLSLRGVPLDSALRLMISFIKLPGEAQKIDRLIEEFAAQWHASNVGALDHPDTAYLIAFSLTMLNSDAHSAQVKKKMTREQYLGQLRGTCKDGSSPDPAMLSGFYARVTRLEWSVEERHLMRIVRQGWMAKKSRRKVAAQDRRLFAVLSSRALYFYAEQTDLEPVAYIRLEGMAVVPRRLGFEVRPAAPVVLGKDGRDSEVRMVKLLDRGDGALAKEPSRHSSFAFVVDTERDAAAWVWAIRDWTLDVPDLPPPAPSAPDADGRRRRATLGGHGGDADSIASVAAAHKASRRAASFARKRRASAAASAQRPAESPDVGASASLSLREQREAMQLNSPAGAPADVATHHAMSLQASRAPRNALAALERKYEGVEQRTGGNGSRRLSMPPPPPPSASAAALVGGPSPAPLDEAAVDGMMAVVAVWLAERAMELEPAAEGAVRRLVAMPKYASEDDVEALLYGACARHEERLESVSRRDGASRAEVERLARTLCAEDFPLPPHHPAAFGSSRANTMPVLPTQRGNAPRRPLDEGSSDGSAPASPTGRRRASPESRHVSFGAQGVHPLASDSDEALSYSESSLRPGSESEASLRMESSLERLSEDLSEDSSRSTAPQQAALPEQAGAEAHAPEVPQMSDAERQAYSGLFASAAAGRTTVTRPAAEPIFAKASTSTEDIDRIWRMCVEARSRRASAALPPDELTADEFRAALHVAAAKFRGLLPEGLPRRMPPGLLPAAAEPEEGVAPVGPPPPPVVVPGDAAARAAATNSAAGRAAAATADSAAAAAAAAAATATERHARLRATASGSSEAAGAALREELPEALRTATADASAAQARLGAESDGLLALLRTGRSHGASSSTTAAAVSSAAAAALQISRLMEESALSEPLEKPPPLGTPLAEVLCAAVGVADRRHYSAPSSAPWPGLGRPAWLRALQAGGVLLRWRKDWPAAPPAPFFFWVEPCAPATGARGEGGGGGGSGGRPVVAWREPAAAGGTERLALLPNQSLSLNSIAESGPLAGPSLEEARGFAARGLLGEGLSDAALLHCCLLVRGSPQAGGGGSPAPTELLLLAPDRASRDGWAANLAEAVAAARTLNAGRREAVEEIRVVEGVGKGERMPVAVADADKARVGRLTPSHGAKRLVSRSRASSVGLADGSDRVGERLGRARASRSASASSFASVGSREELGSGAPSPTDDLRA